jgi:type IV secretory pathway TrbL component
VPTPLNHHKNSFVVLKTSVMSTKQNEGQNRSGSTSPNGPSENGQKKVTDPKNSSAQEGKKPAADAGKKSTFGKR